MGINTTISRWVKKLRRQRTLGQRGEIAAAKYLRRLGYVVVERGQKNAIGELDLVAVDGRTVVFVEVKTRRSLKRGHPSEAVDTNKQRRLTRLAIAFLKRHNLLEYSSRFDVVTITWPDNSRRPKIEHFLNAFQAVGRDRMFS